MTTIYDDQVRRDAMRKAEDAAAQAQRDAANEAAKLANAADVAKRKKEEEERNQITRSELEARFKQVIRAEYAAMDDQTFADEWPRLRAQALERVYNERTAARRAEYAAHF